MSSNEKNETQLEKMLKIVNKMSHQMGVDNSTDVMGNDFYEHLDNMGLIDMNNSLGGTPLVNTTKTYYDASKNISILVPRIDPLNILNLTKAAQETIRKNDFSESYMFSTIFEKNDVLERIKERKFNPTKILEYERIYDLKKRHPFDQLLGLNLMILDKLDNIYRYILKGYILNKIEQHPQGKVFYTKCVLSNGVATTKLNFADWSKNQNPPSTFNYRNVPNTELFSFIIRVDSGGPIQIGINESDTNLDTYIDLNANEEHKIEENAALVRSINMRANGADATVRIIGMF